MDATPQEQHRWLQQLIGDWTFTNEASMGAGQPPIHSSGSEQVRPLGDFWVVCEGAGMMPGAPSEHRSMMTLGFDPKRDSFVGTFIASVMDSLWVYDSGALENDQRTLALNTVGPSFDGNGGTARYIDRITLVDSDERTLTSCVLQPDGQWHQFMQATYRRKR